MRYGIDAYPDSAIIDSSTLCASCGDRPWRYRVTWFGGGTLRADPALLLCRKCRDEVGAVKVEAVL